MPPEATRLVPMERMSVVLVAREAMVMEDFSVSEGLSNDVQRCAAIKKELGIFYESTYVDDIHALFGESFRPIGRH